MRCLSSLFIMHIESCLILKFTLSRILCTNRDEYLARPTQNACFHGPDNGILSGIDLQAGGTWFGINRAGRVALLSVSLLVHPGASLWPGPNVLLLLPSLISLLSAFIFTEQIFPKRLGRIRPHEGNLSLTSCSQTHRITHSMLIYSRVTPRRCTPGSIYFYSRPVSDPILEKLKMLRSKVHW